MAENLMKLFPAIILKAELVSDELGYIVKEISKSSVKGDDWFVLATYSKMKETRDTLREELLNKKGSRLDDFENLHLPQVVKCTNTRRWRLNTVRKPCSRENAQEITL